MIGTQDPGQLNREQCEIGNRRCEQQAQILPVALARVEECGGDLERWVRDLTLPVRE